MGKVGYLVTCDGNTSFFEEKGLPEYVEYDPDYKVVRVVYFELEE